ncbi:UDP-N-acetylmuramoyl-tripeptide--D-alanyl-D-alanine ligase [Streptomyces spinoverrucosus]|uniref:UDP-N-acetylmuramoyl-tripeptide--D-alanyl-D-alanine ligase n=1 Tax=Streptomyces spinoverrucosus TaxID=284043 RepID=A0A4Y3VYW7_9ACTN|nr:UDP-N-acetylmuramoyl-tripeptide--D-alanyl-D-alanine ligase [Streptomyces spinoverrucosus]GEC10226.1 UDP-N-acetylmuramoyl-tripeptide--D-alanyl-D-alanine ligase [Streptomyces spinoverrucosus]GHB96355.1 UDP-N-acetylmuramoyl-tripeptide--D-alanyl-D-alanine ligase [Streptomyces spinoverrucosus]
MIALSLQEISRFVGGELCDVPDARVVVNGPVVVDSRHAAPGSLFVAVRGARTDGHRFAHAAVSAGATAVLAEHPVGAPAIVVPDARRALGELARHVLARLHRPTVIAVTGSAGKTGTKDLLAQVLAAQDVTAAAPSSYNNEIGLPLSVLRADEHTRFLVLEMAARAAGDIAYLTSIAPPDVGVVTNVGTAHIGAFGGKEAICAAKSELVAALPGHGLAVLNADDDAVMSMRRGTAAGVMTFGLDGGDVRATAVEVDACGRPSFTLHHQGEKARIRLRLHGAHHVANAAAAAAAAMGVGMALSDVAEALCRARRLTPGRMQVLERADDVVVINDAFNANPDSMAAALAALASMAGGRRAVAVLGEMRELGEQSSRHHLELGHRAARAGVSDVIAVGEGDATLIRQGAAAAGARATWVPDRDAALTLLITYVKGGDVVLLKGSHAVGLEDTALQLAAAGPSGPSR